MYNYARTEKLYRCRWLNPNDWFLRKLNIAVCVYIYIRFMLNAAITTTVLTTNNQNTSIRLIDGWKPSSSVIDMWKCFILWFVDKCVFFIKPKKCIPTCEYIYIVAPCLIVCTKMLVCIYTSEKTRASNVDDSDDGFKNSGFNT